MSLKSLVTALRSRDALSGLMFLAFAALFGVLSLDLSRGTALRMGAGYFPLLLSLVLAAFGLVILIKALRRVGGGIEDVPWRGVVLVSASVISFGLGFGGLGFLPSVILGTVLAALASGRVRLVPALLLALGMAVFTWAVFIRGLGLPIALIGPWLS